MANEKQDKTASQKEENEKTGSLAGVGAGVITGAAVGSVVPVVGTFAGALVGGVIGSKVGKKFGGALLNSISGDKETTAEKPDVTAELERLAKLKEQGILSEEEFKAAKAKLLGL
jgi:phage tail tape-measure protein